MTSTNDVFNAFIEASKALEELPRIQSELRNTKREVEDLYDALNDIETQRNQARDEGAALATKLSDTEAALAAATFRLAEVESTLRMVRGIVSDPVADASVAPLTAEGSSEATTTPITLPNGEGPALGKPDADATPIGSPQSATTTYVSVETDANISPPVDLSETTLRYAGSETSLLPFADAASSSNGTVVSDPILSYPIPDPAVGNTTNTEHDYHYDSANDREYSHYLRHVI